MEKYSYCDNLRNAIRVEIFNPQDIIRGLPMPLCWSMRGSVATSLSTLVKRPDVNTVCCSIFRWTLSRNKSMNFTMMTSCRGMNNKINHLSQEDVEDVAEPMKVGSTNNPNRIPYPGWFSLSGTLCLLGIPWPESFDSWGRLFFFFFFYKVSCSYSMISSFATGYEFKCQYSISTVKRTNRLENYVWKSRSTLSRLLACLNIHEIALCCLYSISPVFNPSSCI